MPVLEVTNLSKRYGSFTAVDDISFSVDAGSIVGILGPNGAGKTTTTNMILGLLEPTSGEIHAFGESLARKRSAIARRMNFSASYSWLPGNMTPWEHITVFGLLYGVRNYGQKGRKLLDEVRLSEHMHTKSGKLSSGEQSRLALAKALLNDPELLLLDEPTASLDPNSARQVRSLIRDRVRRLGMAVLWTSHNMHEVEEVCDRVFFLSKGKILLQGYPKILPEKHGVENLEELFIAVANESLNHHNG